MIFVRVSDIGGWSGGERENWCGYQRKMRNPCGVGTVQYHTCRPMQMITVFIELKAHRETYISTRRLLEI